MTTAVHKPTYNASEQPTSAAICHSPRFFAAFAEIFVLPMPSVLSCPSSRVTRRSEGQWQRQQREAEGDAPGPERTQRRIVQIHPDPGEKRREGSRANGNAKRNSERGREHLCGDPDQQQRRRDHGVTVLVQVGLGASEAVGRAADRLRHQVSHVVCTEQ